MTTTKGIDYAELADLFNITLPSDDGKSDEEDHAYIGRYIRCFENDKRTIAICRNWLKLFLSKNKTAGEVEIWRGLDRTKDDFSFMRYIVMLLPGMWA